MNTEDKIEQQAKELYSKINTQLIKYRDGMNIGKVLKMKTCAKECAIICVDEILSLDVWDYPHNAEYGKLFWEQVKEKIQSK